MRRRLVLAGLPAFALPARAATLPAARSLRDELASALAMRRPLVVMASLYGCPFCQMVRDSHLAPMARDGLPVVQVDMGSRDRLVGFGGDATTHAAQLEAWRVKVAPTVLFFGPSGREIAARLEGASIPDFYGHYLQERLDAATRAVRGT